MMTHWLVEFRVCSHAISVGQSLPAQDILCTAVYRQLLLPLFRIGSVASKKTIIRHL